MICAACLHPVEAHTSAVCAGFRLCLECRRYDEVRELCYAMARRRRNAERRRRRHEPRGRDDELDAEDPFAGEELRR